MLPRLLAIATAPVERSKNPAAMRSFALAASMMARTCGMNAALRAVAVLSERFSISGYFCGPTGSMRSGFGGDSRASCSDRWTASRIDLSSNSDRLVDPDFPPRVEVIVIHCSVVKPEVVTPLSANRIDARSRPSIRSSHSGKVEKESALSMCLFACSLVGMACSSGSIRQQHIDSPEPRRRAAMTDRINLTRLPLAVIRCAPLHPVTRASDPVARLPEIGRAGLVGHTRKHPLFLAAFDGPEGVAPELEVIALVIDRPAAIAIDEDAVVDARNQVIERQVRLSRLEPNVGHPLERHARPVIGVAAAA